MIRRLYTAQSPSNKNQRQQNPNLENGSCILRYTSGSQLGCRGALGCHLRYSGMPLPNTIFNISLNILISKCHQTLNQITMGFPLCAARAVSAALNSLPTIGGGGLSQGLKIQSRHHLAPKESFDPPN